MLEEGVHRASDAWSIVAIGERDPPQPEPLQVTYPPLYNCFGVLHRLRFETRRGERDLSAYLKFVEAGQYLSSAQLAAKRTGKNVKNPGPYAPLGQILQTLRKLTPAAADAMNAAHERAMIGRRLFFSYKWDDVELLAGARGQTRKEWVRELNHEIEEAGYSSWLDHHQILAEEDIGDLLDEVLADAVRQSVVFVALLSKEYGTGWTLKEWNRASKQLRNEKRRDRLQPVVIDCGGTPERIGLQKRNTLVVALPPTPRDVVLAIERGVRQARS